MIYVGLVLIGLFFLFCARIGWRIGGQVVNTINYQVPSPAQIAEQLRIELGREPALTEVAAVHQMLTANHNSELIGVAALLGAAYTIDHTHL